VLSLYSSSRSLVFDDLKMKTINSAGSFLVKRGKVRGCDEM
jgi:hypothetical protein